MCTQNIYKIDEQRGKKAKETFGFCYKQREALRLDVSNLFNVIGNSNFLFSCFLATKTSLKKK